MRQTNTVTTISHSEQPKGTQFAGSSPLRRPIILPAFHGDERSEESEMRAMMTARRFEVDQTRAANSECHYSRQGVTKRAAALEYHSQVTHSHSKETRHTSRGLRRYSGDLLRSSPVW